MNDKIVIDKQRVFSEIIIDSFIFFKENFRQLLKFYFIIVGPLAVIAAFFNMKMRWVLLENDMQFTMDVISVAMTYYLFAFFTFGLILTTTLGYIKLIDEFGKENISLDMMWQFVWHKIGTILVASFLCGVFIAVGLFLLIIPAIWIMVPLYFVPIFIILDSKKISESFTFSFFLVKGFWFQTFSILVVLFGISIIIALVILFPVSYFDQSILDNGSESMNFTYYGIIGIIFNVIGNIISILPVIWMTFQFYNLRKIKSNESTL